VAAPKSATRAARGARAAVKAPAKQAGAAADATRAAVAAPAEGAKQVARAPQKAARRARRSLTGKKLSKTAIDLMIGAIPGEVVRDMAQVSAPLARYSGASSVSAALLARSMQVLAQPPTSGAVSDAMTLGQIAELVGRSRQALTGWAGAGLLGEPKKVGRTKRWGRDALERARLVDYLLRHGAVPEELFEAAANNQLALTVLKRSIGRPATTTREEAAAAAGVPPELLARFTRALGAAPGEPDEPVYTDSEMDALRLLGAMRSVYSDDDLVEVASVVGRATHEIAEAFLELFRRRFTRPFADAGASELEMMLRLATVIELTVPTTGPLLEMILRRQLEASALEETILEVEHQAGGLDGTIEQAVGFADIVGFTSASVRMNALEVSQMAEKLLHAAEEATLGRSARIVKSIGDAVMFTAPDLLTAGAVAADLLEAAAASGLPPVRIGVAYGPMLRAYADFFGRTVNVASRLTEIAPAGGILAAKPERHISDHDWNAAGLSVQDGGKKRLRGVDGRVPVLRLKRLG
jgi:adenylate cyclase